MTVSTGVATFIGGSGGGVAFTHATPSYQANNKQAQRILKSQGYQHGRIVPDVSAIADPYAGACVVFTDSTGAQNLYQTGGTSLACPTFVAMMTLNQQRLKFKFGFPLIFFYKNPDLFRDILPAKEFKIVDSTTVKLLAPYDAGLVVTTDYDNWTGLGSPAPKFFTFQLA